MASSLVDSEDHKSGQPVGARLASGRLIWVVAARCQAPRLALQGLGHLPVLQGVSASPERGNDNAHAKSFPKPAPDSVQNAEANTGGDTPGTCCHLLGLPVGCSLKAFSCGELFP